MTAQTDRAPEILEKVLTWDNHVCIGPWEWDDRACLDDACMSHLERCRNAGFKIVSVNVYGSHAVPWEQTCLNLAHARHWLRRHSDRYMQVETVADLTKARRSSRLGVFFDVEGGKALNGQLGMVELYRDLGVRWMLIAYNRNNDLGGGCMDEDGGLTDFGRRVVSEMERVGMTVCCSHTGFRTTMDVMAHAAKPVIFSHSNPLGMWQHKRNIRDEAIRACAQTGGVVCINGRPETLVAHIDYVAQLVGADHVGLGLDFVFADMDEFMRHIEAHPEVWPPPPGGHPPPKFVPPEALRDITEGLLVRGYRLADLRKILGGNLLRVAQATWPQPR